MIPTLVVPSPASPNALANDDANLYWMNSSTYDASTANISVQAMVADDRYLYFIETDPAGAGSIKRCPHAACPTPETVAPGLTFPSALVQDSVSIYWAHRPTGGYNGPATIQRLAK